ncbi:hypothetical protein [Nocardioides marmoriginsengisoli]|uniref:hypothetical protein n=1 Tax=Nocardioides marmoriginsengisoli TaxID=661483 RepID=UPI00160D995E|nr:hypothetical protein [Nocardioides marmoriginsengisoli]
MRAVRRSAPWFVAAVVFALLSIPALFDLHGLLVGLAVICAGLGLATAAFTWADRPKV